MFNIHALGVLWKARSGDFNTSVVCPSTIVETIFAPKTVEHASF